MSAQRVVILGTGGTIAGTGDDPGRAWSYRAAQLSVEQLVTAVPALAAVPLETMQVAQVDSKDMTWAVWRALGQALAAQLSRADVAGVVVTHGTDTLEETAWLLNALHDGSKPVVLTAAMRPATAPDADGPRNLLDAVHAVQALSARQVGGVFVVMQSVAWPAQHVRKAHSHALDAFDGGGAMPVGRVDSQGVWDWSLQDVPACGGVGWPWLDMVPPRVEIVTSHADADGWVVDALVAHSQVSAQRPLRGLVVASTGHGTLHEGMTAALVRAASAGVLVWRSSKVARGGVMPREGDRWTGVPGLTASQARVAMILHLLGACVRK